MDFYEETRPRYGSERNAKLAFIAKVTYAIG